MKWRRVVVALSVWVWLCAGLIACETRRWESDAKFDTSYDFSGIDTFAFAPAREKVAASASGKITEQAIREELTSRGYREVPSSEAGILISYDVGVYAAAGLGGQNRFKRCQGGITVWMYDPETMQNVWYGWTESVLKADDTAQSAIPEAVGALFEDRIPRAPAS